MTTISYLAEVKVILDATDEDKIGDIIFLKQIFLSDAMRNRMRIYSRIYQRTHSDQGQTEHTFYVSGGDKLRFLHINETN